MTHDRACAALAVLICLLPCASAPAAAQRAPAAVSAESLRADVFAIADDSMGGRATGSIGNVQTADWVAAAFRRYGLEPAGDGGGYFQTIPFLSLGLDTGAVLEVGGTRLSVPRDVLPVGILLSWTANGARTIYGGVVDDSTTWPPADSCRGKLVVMKPPAAGDLQAVLHGALLLRRDARFRSVAGFAIAALDSTPPDFITQIITRRATTDTLAFRAARTTLFVTASAASRLLGAPLATAVTGQTGPAVTGGITFSRPPLRLPARNVVAVLRGGDPALNGTYVSISAHNDHVGIAPRGVDHDSIRAFDRVVRPLGADSPRRPATPEEEARIRRTLDSLRALHAPRRDSIYNGADDDGSGTALLVELARVLAAGPRPRRSILFVSHAAEEIGLLGSRWYTEHPTVPRDSIVAELDADMVGRGGAGDLPSGGPGYLELVGSRRLSTELGNLIDSIGTHERVPFRFNYEFDAPGHPLQYYCRADHFSYARYGIPSASLSTGEHLDYHQVTDEPQYLDYHQLARVTELVRDVVLAVANLDHRPAVDGRRQDPKAPCRQ